MIRLGQWAGRPVNISIKPNCITVSVDRPEETSVFSFDYAGRLWTAFLDGVSYRRGLDGKMIAKWRLPGNARERRWVPRPEALQIEETARAQTEALYAAIQSGEAVLNAPLPPDGDHGFRQAIAFNAERSQADAERYYAIYKPVGILPPDQYMAVVLQATEGCSFNTCTFCDFFRDRPFRIKPPDEFRAHAQAVRGYLGEGFSLRRTIFLGDANALVIPMPRLVSLMEIVHEVYDVRALEGIYAFLDGFSGERKSAEDYRTLADLGLAMVYIGLESGSADLLRFLKKPAMPEEVIHAVRALKQGGVSVGLIVLLGAGGHTYAEEHVRETINVLNAMELDGGDLIYFSELVVSDTLPYARDAYQAGLQPLTAEERIAQGEAIEAGLRFADEADSPRISRYDIREFIY